MSEFVFFLLGLGIGGGLGLGITNEVWYRVAGRQVREMAAGWQESIDTLGAAWKADIDRWAARGDGEQG